MVPQLSICVLTSEVPLNGSLFGISCLLPRIDFGLKLLAAANSPIQALPAQYADLNFRHVQPARVLGRVVELHATQQLRGRTLAEHIVEAPSEVGVQVVQHQMNSACLGVCPSKQLTDEGDEINFPTLGRHRDDSPSRFPYPPASARGYSRWGCCSPPNFCLP